MKLKDRVALVTGGGSGIGRAICERFADEGARVVVNDVRQEAAEATAKALGAGARAIAADVADSKAVRAMFAVIDREHGRLDVLVNAIGPGYIDTPMTAGISDLSRTMVLGRTPMGRVGEPREIAATALFLASDESSFTTGQWLSPNGGLFIG